MKATGFRLPCCYKETFSGLQDIKNIDYESKKEKVQSEN